jgi:hypothetical protein
MGRSSEASLKFGRNSTMEKSVPISEAMLQCPENAMFPEAQVILADHLEDLMDHMVALKQQLTSSPQQ